MVKDYGQLASKLKKLLYMKTEPLGIGLVKSGEKKPEGFIEPFKDLGYHLSTCQAWSFSRRRKMALIESIEDMWCFEPVMGLGFANPPDIFLKGHNRFPDTASSLEAGKEWASNMPRFPVGEYESITSAPLSYYGENFSPDVVVLYCDPAQLTQIMVAVNWIDGKDIYTRISGHAACVYAVVPVIQNNDFQVVVPCAGDRKRAMAQDNEIIFSCPIDKLEKLIEGLENIDQHGGALPVDFSLKEEYELEESYQKMGTMVGMNLKKQ